MISPNAIDHLRRSPRMHLGHDSATAPQLAGFIVADALHLGASHVSVLRHSPWTAVSADVEWVRRGAGERLTIADLFTRYLPLSEAGVNERRHESFLVAYCSSVFVAGIGTVQIVAGAAPPEQLANRLDARLFHVGFELIEHGGISPDDSRRTNT